MSEHTPEYLRTLANDVQHTVDNGYELAAENVVAALRDAADEVDRLRRQRDQAELRANACIESVRSYDTANSRLRYSIENAPHPKNCDVYSGAYGYPCNCWKADAL